MNADASARSDSTPAPSTDPPSTYAPSTCTAPRSESPRSESPRSESPRSESSQCVSDETPSAGPSAAHDDASDAGSNGAVEASETGSGSTGRTPSVVYHAPIHAWDPSDRPREKLIQSGASVLSDAELLALLLGSGTRTSDGPLSAVELGRTLLQTFGDGLPMLSQRALKELTRVRGVGPAKASKLLAAFELGRRVESQRTREPRTQICAPADVAAVYGPLMRDLKKEIFKVVHLNTASVVIGDYTISEGGLASSIVEPRAVFEKAILDNAASVICLHNHPSGNPEPSREDIRITRQLVEAGALMGIPVHDHVIIAGTTFTSLAERGIID